MVWYGKDHVCEIIVSDRKLMINFSSCRGNRLPGTNKTKTKKRKELISRKSYLLTAALHNCKCFTGKEERDTGDWGAQSLLKIQYMYYYEGGRQRHKGMDQQKLERS